MRHRILVNLRKISCSFKAFLKISMQIIYGATIYDMVRDLNKERSNLERMFILTVFGDVLGVPILSPYFTLRLLPYVAPFFKNWQISLLRERDLIDLCDQDFT